jgi:hypothetical protein
MQRRNTHTREWEEDDDTEHTHDLRCAQLMRLLCLPFIHLDPKIKKEKEIPSWYPSPSRDVVARGCLFQCRAVGVVQLWPRLARLCWEGAART